MRISDWSSDVCSSDLAAYLQPCQKFRLSYYSLTLHSYAGSVFRSPAPDDVTAVPQKLSLGVLMGLADPPGNDGEQLRIAQFRSVDRLGGIYFLFTSLAVVFVFGGFAGSVRLPALGLWALAALAHGLFYFRTGHARVRTDYADISSATIRLDGVALFVQGLIWSDPPIFFAHPATPLELISLWTLTRCITVGTALMYVGLPLSSIAFLSAVDRPSVLSGRRVTVGVDRGGRRVLNK